MAGQTSTDGEKVSLIQTLTSRAQQLDGSVIWWNRAYVLMVATAAVIAAFVFITQFVAIRKARQLAVVQGDLMLADSREKDLKIAEAQQSAEAADERSNNLEHANLALRSQVATLETNAAKANKELAGLQKSASDAKSAQQRVEIELAKQRELTANAETRLLELQERIKPRRLTDKQSADFVAVLSTLPDTALKLGHTAGGGDEGFNLLQQLMPLFRQAHWKVPATTSEVNSHLDVQVIGIALLIPGPEGSDPRKPEPTAMIQLNPEQAALQAAFKAAGMNLQFQRWFHTADGVSELVVGSKPNP